MCRRAEKHVRTSCSVREIFWSFILWTPAWAEPTSAAAAIRVLFMMGDTCRRQPNDEGWVKMDKRRWRLSGLMKMMEMELEMEMDDGGRMML